ncbi:hypothetical protein D4R75_09645 [bacterium]|nr:MAG: hypothetical protein D4R75_09645 [bacterium]
MFKKRRIADFTVKVTISREVLESIFDECDRFESDETGGRLVGFYRHHGSTLEIEACGLIGPGSNARRSRVSFFQEGDYQESVFRQIEAVHPEVEHLGNWHTHHVNGLDTLSSGDVGTYTKIVNHDKHNTDFFYAILIVAKASSGRDRERYRAKHFLFRRGVPGHYEIPQSQIRVVDKPPIYLEPETIENDRQERAGPLPPLPVANEIRATDKIVLSEMFPTLKPFCSKGTKSLYWKGNIPLIDASLAEILILESLQGDKPSYSITLGGPDARRFQCREFYLHRTFAFAWKAAYSFERDLNRELFQSLKGNRIQSQEGQL